MASTCASCEKVSTVKVMLCQCASPTWMDQACVPSASALAEHDLHGADLLAARARARHSLRAAVSISTGAADEQAVVRRPSADLEHADGGAVSAGAEFGVPHCAA